MVYKLKYFLALGLAVLEVLDRFGFLHEETSRVLHGKQNQVSACPHYLPKIYEYLYIHVYLIKYK